MRLFRALCGVFALAVLISAPRTSADVLFDYTSDSDGYWHDGSNWNLGVAPNGSLDIVTINRPAADPTVTYNGTTGTSQVKSLTSSESIVLTGGTLEILDTANLTGSFSLAGGTLRGGVITTSVGLDVNYATGNTLDSLALEGDLKLEHNQDQIAITGGLELDGTIVATGKDALIYFKGTQTLSALGGGTALLSMTGSYSAPDYVRVYASDGGVLTIDSGVTVEGKGYLDSSGTGSAIHNEGTIHANTSGTLYIVPDTFVNEASGTLQIDAGAGLSLGGGSWDNQGTLNLDGGTLTLGTDFMTARINQGSMTRTAGSTVNLTGNLDNTGDVLDAVGEIHLSGGTITGGTSLVDIHATSNSNEAIDSLALEGDLKLESTQDQITITGGLELDGTIVATGKDALIYFKGTQTLSALGGGTALLSMTGSYSAPDYVRVYASDGGVLTIDSGVTVEGKGYLDSSGTGSAIHNEGTIHANTSGTLYIVPDTFVNEASGTLQIDAGAGLSLGGGSWDNQGTLNLDGGTLTLGTDFMTARINQGSMTRTAGSTVNLTGNLDNTGDVLDAVGEIHLSGGTITGGTSLVDIHATYDNDESLDSLALEGDLKLEHNQDQITITGGLELDGTIVATGKDALIYFKGTQTLSALGGGTALLSMTGSYSAPDYVRVYASDGGVLTIDSGVTVEGKGYLDSSGTGSAIHNEGTIHANTSGTLYIVPDTFVNEASGTLQIDAGAGLSLGGDSWDNQGTLNLDGGTLTLGTDFMTARINQGSMTRTAGSTVNLTGNLDNTGDVLDAVGEIHLSGGTITGGTSLVDIHATYDNDESLDSLALEGDLKLEHNQDQITITGGLELDGTIVATGKDALIYFKGTQTLSALGGGTALLSMTGSYSPPDYVRVYASGGGVLTIGSGVTVEGKGYLDSSGTGSAIHNEGTIHANTSGTLYIVPDTFVNEASGTLQVSGGSGLSLAAAAFENHGAIELTDDGLLYTSGLGSAGLELLSGSSLLGKGTVSGSVTNTAGLLSPDAITLNGDYVQGAAGELSIGVGGLVQGVDYDFLDVSGAATLAGSLLLQLEDGFFPAVTDTFIILEADGGLSGTFDSVVGLDGSSWNVSYLAASVVITFEGMSVPEPGAALLGVGGLWIVLGYCRLRRRA